MNTHKTECSECGEPFGIEDCHHHNTAEFNDDAGTLVVQCEDCPEWWLLACVEGGA
jgi:hypothetical protein